MTAHQLISSSASSVAGAVTMGLAWRWSALPDWLGIVRSVMMVLGGLVVIVLILVVAIAVVSGVMGMIGNLRKPNK